MDPMPSNNGTDGDQPSLPPPGFDVYNQPFELMGSDGVTTTLSTGDIDFIRVTAVRSAIIFATQLGASAILLLVLLLMTPGAKRRSLSWIFNVLALVCNVIRCTIQCTEMTGPFLNFVLLTLQEYGDVSLGKHVRISIANSAMTALVFIFIELALVTQVHVICAATIARLWRVCILSFCGIVAMLAVGFRLNLMIRNCQETADLGKGIVATPENARKLEWAQSTSNTMAIISICVFSSVFCIKLGLAIKSRRSLGLKQFGAMQIIFIMGCQTLTIPVIFAILDYYAIRGTQLGSFVETLVAIFLPLSSMWASTNVKSQHIGRAMHEKGAHRAIPVGHSDFGTGGGSTSYSSKKQLMDDDTVDTLVNRTPTSSYNKSSPTKHEPRNEPRVSVTAGHRLSCLSDGDEDLELGKLGKSIHVDKSYTVLSEPDWAVGRAR